MVASPNCMHFCNSKLSVPSFTALAILALGLGGACPVEAMTLKQAAQATQARNAKLLEAWSSGSVTGSAVKLFGKSANVHALTKNNVLFVLRAPKRGVDDAVTKNQVFQIMAAQFGEPQLVPAAGVSASSSATNALTSTRSVMVMEHAGADFVDGDQVGKTLSRNRLLALPERTRLAAALIDLLTEHQDRRARNVMIKTDGTQVRLIDPDVALGTRFKKHPSYASVFFPGGMLAYAKSVAAFSDLPGDLMEVVSEIASSSSESLARAYRIDNSQARIVLHRAQRVQEVGLDHAIAEYLASMTLVPAEQL